MFYRIDLSEQQAKIVAAALDLYSRIGIGQMEIVSEVMVDLNIINPLGTGREVITEKLHEIKALLGHPKNGSFGICNPVVNDDVKTAYDLECVIKKELTSNCVSRVGTNVWSYDPLHTNKKEPLAEIRTMTNRDDCTLF